MLLRLVPLIATAGLVVAAWCTGLADLAKPNAIERVAALGHPVVVSIAVVGIFLVAIQLMVPLTLLLAATVLTLGGLHGALTAWVAAVAACAIGFALGRHAGAGWLADRVRTIGSSALRPDRHGLAMVLLVRLLPVAPAFIGNVALGALGVRWRHFIVGSAAGTLPAIILFAVFRERIWQLRTPAPIPVVIALVVLAALVFLRKTVRRRVDAWAARRGQTQTAGETPADLPADVSPAD